MSRYAKRPKPTASIGSLAAVMMDRFGAHASQNPLVTGGGVAFAVVMFFVSTNALFYQPFQHKDAFFSTRLMNNYVTPILPKSVSLTDSQGTKSEIFKIAREGEPAVQKNRQLLDIQSALAGMKLYSGSLDGLPGPRTREAISTFQQQAGLEPTGMVDPLLLDAIRTASIPADSIPAPRLKTQNLQTVPTLVTASSAVGLSEDDIKKLQAGLKAFGNDGIEIDGKIGDKTKQAILEFQGLFQLSKTGVADRATLNKLQEIGLVAG